MAGFLYQTTSAITDPLGMLWAAIASQLPALVGAVIVLIIGCFVAVILGHAVRLILEKLRVDHYVRQGHLTRAVGHTHVPATAGELFKWYIIILFLQQSVAMLNLGTISSLLGTFVNWLPSVLVAAVIVLFGIAVANYVQIKMVEHSKQRGVAAVAGIFKVVILVMVIILSLKQIGVDVSILENTFMLIVGALAIGIALALGIGLGLGLRKESENIVKDLRKHF